jgi:predicted TIM-barrel fold metal-dependent hydrolase
MDAHPIIDPHIHFWDLGTHDYPWLTERPQRLRVAGDVSPIARNYLVADYRADTARQNVVKAVHVDAGWRYDDPVGETRWLQEFHERTGWPHAIVARAELDAPDIEQILDAHMESPLLRGVRHIANWHPDPEKTYIARPDLLTDLAFERGFAALAERGLSFDLQIYPAQMRDAATLAARHPEVPVILNHTGMPADKDAAGLALWREGMRRLADLRRSA